MTKYRIKKIPNLGYIIEKYLEWVEGFIFKKHKSQWYPLSKAGYVPNKWVKINISFYDSLEEARKALNEIKKGFEIVEE